jgi:hypothetical protein
MRYQSGHAIHEASGHAATIAASATKVFDLEERPLHAMMTVIDTLR